MQTFRCLPLGKALAALLIFASICFSQSAAKNDSTEDLNLLRKKAIDLADKNIYLEAFPILDKIAASFPNDVEVWEAYGMGLAARAASEPNAELRQGFYKKAYEALTRAKKLGMSSPIALSLLDNMSPEGVKDNFISDNPEVEKALREGEMYFGKGEYDKAFVLYEKAYKLDPQSYEAALFAGDCFYAQKKFAESEPWFAKAVAINPDRETAYRFWGDALLGQKKFKEAREKFVDAFMAMPYSRDAWASLDKMSEVFETRPLVKMIIPPANKPFSPISLDETLLSQADGTIHWLKYPQTRVTWKLDLFQKNFPDEEEYRHSLKEETAALNAVAEAVQKDMTAGKITNLHHSLKNLLELKEKGLLEPYILIFMYDEGITEDYDDYREKNRRKLRDFIDKYLFAFAE